MKSVRFCLCFIFVVFLSNYHTADAGVAGSIAAVVSLPVSLPLKIATLPIKIATLPLTLAMKLPTLIIKEVIVLMSKLVKIIATIETNGFTDITHLVKAIVSMIEEIVTSIVNGLVSIGVFQGKSAEEIINFIMTVVKSIFAFLGNTEMALSSDAVNTFLGILKALKIKDILNLPGISLVKKELVNIFMKLKSLYGKKAGMIMNLVMSQIDKHRDFFQPIFNAVSSRVLIVVNAMQGLLTGDLSSCPGSTLASKSPVNSLMWQLNVWFDKSTLILFKVMGLTAMAEKAQMKLDEEMAKMNPAS
ncbi:unnamed protein product [Ceutorhynchus assimilis]|uniref:Uncharacterized protein n=1 Tax=Ceutorhynchus assimilis TaxID=467358 RepID=A0A9N9QQV4_9CUCU|nr:unnamed protein product [Ceutorhynchus assimilis]